VTTEGAFMRCEVVEYGGQVLWRFKPQVGVILEREAWRDSGFKLRAACMV
jgi:hypothetical protein